MNQRKRGLLVAPVAVAIAVGTGVSPVSADPDTDVPASCAARVATGKGGSDEIIDNAHQRQMDEIAQGSCIGRP
jgi:hypothetical protein